MKEYKVLEVEAWDLEKVLNELAEDGWEVKHMTELDRGRVVYRIVFVREKK